MASSILLFFIVMLNPYVIAALLFAVVYAMLVAYPYFYRENEEVKIDYEEDVEIRQEKNALDWGIYIIFKGKLPFS